MSSIQQEKLSLYTSGNIELIARQVVEGFITGLHKSPFHGFSVEFAEHRLYNTGESTRHIDWKLFGRTDKLFVKRYEEETNLRCQIVIDRSSSMYYPLENMKNGDPNKITFSIYCAAALINLLKRQRDAFGLSVFANEVELQTQARSSVTHQKMVFHELDKLLFQPSDKKITNAAKAFHQIAENTHKRSLVVIFSDMMDAGSSNDELFSALQHLRHNKHEVILFHVTDKKSEIDFEFENRPYTFVDMETGEELKLNPSQVKEAYVNAAKKHEKELYLRCAQYKIDFVEANIAKGFDQVLMPYLVKRQKML